MLKNIDRSPALARLIAAMSSTLARQRGLLIVIGVALVAISFVINLIDLSLNVPFLALLWSLTHHIGLLVALIGILLMEPLGR